MPISEESFKAKRRLADEEYFSESYAEARAKFRWAAAALAEGGAEVRLEELLVKEPDYTIDVAIVKGTGNRGLAVHSSGVHGVEGYAGSAIQTAALHDLHCSGAKPEVTCVLIHAVNPYGMAHFRRWNENSVDLNRNALTADGWKEVLERDPNIAGYEDFQDLLVARSAPSWWFVNFGIWIKSIYLIARYGIRHLKRAMVSSTYQHAKGIFFGGRELQPSHRLLWDFMGRHFGSVRSSDVAWMDVHTGLGPSGVDVLLCQNSVKELVATSFPGAGVQCTDDAGSANGSQAAGYELVRGFIDGFYKHVFQLVGGLAPVIATQEFGTVPPVMVARSLVIENRGYHFDYANHQRWRAFTRDAFYVRTPTWKRSVLQRGMIVFGQLTKLASRQSSL